MAFRSPTQNSTQRKKNPLSANRNAKAPPAHSGSRAAPTRASCQPAARRVSACEQDQVPVRVFAPAPELGRASPVRCENESTGFAGESGGCAANASALKRNFADGTLLYVPEVYFDYTYRDALVLERMDFLPVRVGLQPR